MTQSRRFLLINYEYPPIGGGGGNATFHIARQLAAQGHSPFVLTAAWRDLPITENVDGVVVRRIAALRRHADRCSIFEMFSFLISASLAAPGWVRHWKCEAVIVFFTVPCGPIGWILKRILKLPYCLSLQGGDVPGFDPETLKLHHTLAGPVIRLLWRDADAVVANSSGLAELAQKFDPSTNVKVIPAGADLDGIAPKSEYSTSNCIQLLFVGRFVRQKGLDVLLNALGNLPDDLNWRLTLVGDGPEIRSLKSQADGLNVKRKVMFKPWVDKESLAVIYKDADIFLLPSRDEGMANVLLEAMAAGLPVIGTSVSGTAEVIRDQRDGVTVPPENADALAAAIAELIRDERRREILGRSARARVESSYSWSTSAAQWVEVLEKSMQCKSAQ